MQAVHQMRWDYYYMRRGLLCQRFWSEFLTDGSRKILLILGRGFDSRMCDGLKMLLTARNDCIERCLLIEYDEGEHSPSNQYQSQVDLNLNSLSSMMSGNESIYTAQVAMWSEDKKRRTGSRRASEAIDEKDLDGITDIVVDISAMPRGIYFPIIAKILTMLDGCSNLRLHTNLHVLVAEDIEMDKNIQEEGIDDQASYMHGFASDLVQDALTGVPLVWIPILGEGKESQFTRLHNHAGPHEICPVLPSPSVNPRRVDDLVAEYRELMFDTYRVEPSNFIYASESNPFEVYRQIYRTIERYAHALEDLGGCRIVISVLSSKLLSVGALLAAYEAKRSRFMVGISHVETRGYRMIMPSLNSSSELFSLWLAGECYDA